MKRFKLKGRMRRAGIGALPILAGILMASGLLRLGGGTGQAIAREVGALAAGDLRQEPCGPTEDVAAVLDALNARSERLDDAEADLEERKAALDSARDEIARQLTALEQAESELEGLLKKTETAAEGDLARLTSVYETMKPKEAAALFSQMAPTFAAGFLGRMRPESAAQILAGLDPETAYSISVMLAGRYADLPSE